MTMSKFAQAVAEANHLPDEILKRQHKWEWQSMEGAEAFWFDDPSAFVEHDDATALISGAITENTYTDLAKWLGKHADEKTLRINSYGGNAAAGIACYNLLSDCAYAVKTIIDGVAFSAASLIASGGRPLVMPAGASLGIHQASVMSYGNKTQLTHDADLLRVMDGLQLEILTARPNAAKNVAKIRAAIEKETMYSGSEAVKLGLADEVGAGKMKVKMKPKKAEAKAAVKEQPKAEVANTSDLASFIFGAGI